MKITVKIMILVAATALAGLHPVPAPARPEFAQLTGNPCSACHVSPQGGGALTPEGEKFRQRLNDLEIPVDPDLRISTGERLLYIALYLLHIPFGVAWLGLFVYAFGPALRKRSVPLPPKPYIRKILYSAAVVAVSGPLLLAIKMKMVPGLFGTRFGLLLLVKVTAAVMLLAATAALVWHISVVLSRRYRRLARTLDAGDGLDMTSEDLLLFDGSEKRRALVAVDGKIYDVTGRNLWRKGIHPGGHHAGEDLTADFSGAPHGKEVFDRVIPVGRMITPDTKTGKKTLRWAVPAGVAASGIILLVVALWRW